VLGVLDEDLGAALDGHSGSVLRHQSKRKNVTCGESSLLVSATREGSLRCPHGDQEGEEEGSAEVHDQEAQRKGEARREASETGRQEAQRQEAESREEAGREEAGRKEAGREEGSGCEEAGGEEVNGEEAERQEAEGREEAGCKEACRRCKETEPERAVEGIDAA
jgi:hypothetical protein